jgi:hypothetical protein
MVTSSRAPITISAYCWLITIRLWNSQRTKNVPTSVAVRSLRLPTATQMIGMAAAGSAMAAGTMNWPQAE